MKRIRLALAFIAGIVLGACQIADAPAGEVTRIALETSTPESSATSLATRTPAQSGSRHAIEGLFSFVAPLGYLAEFEETSAFLTSPDEDVFLSLAIIGVGDDDRNVHELVDEIFVSFGGVTFEKTRSIQLSGMAGQQTHFNGVLQNSIVSGSYAIVDLTEDVGFLALGFGRVVENQDSWLQYGAQDFEILLPTIEIVQ